MRLLLATFRVIFLLSPPHLHHSIFSAEKMGNTKGKLQTGRGSGKGKSFLGKWKGLIRSYGKYGFILQ
jgi:hypothetical protein